MSNCEMCHKEIVSMECSYEKITGFMVEKWNCITCGKDLCAECAYGFEDSPKTKCINCL